MEKAVHSRSVSRRQPASVPSQRGGCPAATLLTSITHSSTASPVPATEKAHQRSPSLDGGSWCEQLLVPPPVSFQRPSKIRRGAATPAGKGMPERQTASGALASGAASGAAVSAAAASTAASRTASAPGGAALPQPSARDANAKKRRRGSIARILAPRRFFDRPASPGGRTGMRTIGVVVVGWLASTAPALAGQPVVLPAVKVEVVERAPIVSTSAPNMRATRAFVDGKEVLWGERQVGAELAYVTSDAGLDGRPVRFTDLVTARLAGRATLGMRFELAGRLELLVKQPFPGGQSPFGGGALTGRLQLAERSSLYLSAGAAPLAGAPGAA